MGKIIGIDLGTTNSVVAIMEGSEPAVIANEEGSRLTPSVVAFTDKGDRLVGLPAKRQAVTNPRNTVFSIKRFMGRRHHEVGTEEKTVPYTIVGEPNDLVKVRAGDKEHSPPEISAMILRKLKETAEAHLGEKVTQAVITVPAYINASSTSPPRRRWPTASTRRRARGSRCSTSAAARSTSASSRSTRASSRCCRRTATRTWAAMTSTRP